MFKVKEFSKITGLSPKALKIYEEILLLHPQRSEKNYRLYSEADIARCSQILEFKEAGLSLKEITEFINGDSITKDEFRIKLDSKFQSLGNEVEKLEVQRNNIRTMLLSEAGGEQKESNFCKDSCLSNGDLGAISWALIDALRQSGAHAQSNSLVSTMNNFFENLDPKISEKIIEDCSDHLHDHESISWKRGCTRK